MDYLDEADRKHEWERMVGVAMNLHRGMPKPASTSLLAEVVKHLDSVVVPAQGERSYLGQPEGLVAVKASLESPHAESKTMPWTSVPVPRRPTRGMAPRVFAVDPTGKYLLVANEATDNVIAFEIDARSGLLAPTCNILKIDSPTCVKFARIDLLME